VRKSSYKRPRVLPLGALFFLLMTALGSMAGMATDLSIHHVTIEQATPDTPRSEATFSGLGGGESCTCLRRIPGTKDVVLFWNHSEYKEHHHYGERTPLTAAISSDNGESWRIIGNIADDPEAEYTNLDCFFTSKGKAILTYMVAKPAWNRDQISLRAALIPLKWFDPKCRGGRRGQTGESRYVEVSRVWETERRRLQVLPGVWQAALRP